MALEENITRDLSKIKTKIVLGLTARQLVCFGGGFALALPMFFFTKKYIGVESAALICMIICVPFFILGLYEKHGISVERLLFYSLRQRYIRSTVRPRIIKTKKEIEAENEKIGKEIMELERKAKRGGRRN